MSIGVQSFAELYTTLIGWQMYDQMWNLLSQTGIAYLPFIGVILKNVIQPYESQETKSASATSLRRMEMDVIVMLLVIFFGVSPALPLDVSTVEYTPACQPNGANNTYHAGSTGTTYDKAFAVPKGDIRVPIWWYAVLSFSAGTTAAANTMVACVPDYRKMVTQVNMSQIQSPAIKQELQQFMKDCYLPARTQYLQENQNDPSNNPLIQRDIHEYGVEDTEWVGSHSFQDTYYQTLKASQPIPGFPYDPTQDVNAGAYQNTPTPTNGTPTCAAWWNDLNGLKSQLNASLPTDFFNEFKDIFHDEQRKDDVIKRIVSNGGGGFESADNMTMPHDYGISHALAAIGIDFSSLEAYPTIYAIAQAAPIAQALLLLMVFAFLPIVLVFAGYKPAAFATGAIVIFSIFFWSYIWHLVAWTDSTLNLALYDNSWWELRSANATLTNIIIGFLQIVAPLFWFGFMSALGVAAGSLVTTLTNVMTHLVSTPSNNAGNQAANVVKTGAGMAIKVVNHYSKE